MYTCNYVTFMYTCMYTCKYMYGYNLNYTCTYNVKTDCANSTSLSSEAPVHVYLDTCIQCSMHNIHVHVQITCMYIIHTCICKYNYIQYL